MSFVVKKVEETDTTKYKPVTSVPLNVGTATDSVLTTLSIQARDTTTSRSAQLRRESSILPPPSDHWYSWSNLFRLRKQSVSLDVPGSPTTDDFFSVDDATVFLEQTSKGSGSVWYKLYTSSSMEESKVACESLTRTLKYFAAERIPEELLLDLVLPQPKTLIDIPKVVFQYLKSHQSKAENAFLVDLHINNLPLTHHACVADEVVALECLLESGAELQCEDQNTGNGLLHTAAKYSHSCLVVLLDTLRAMCSKEEYHEAINKLNHHHFDSKRLKNPTSGMHMLSLALGEMNILGLAPHRLSPEPCRKERSGVTPLMLAVGAENIKCTGILLACGADPNIGDPSLKTTALHIAATLGNTALMQLLLTFGADTDCENDENETPLDLAKKLSHTKCAEMLQEVSLLRKQAKKAWGNGKPQASVNNGEYLLCIDGGGTRALIPAFILNLVEERMRSITKKKNLQISKYFNWLSGTSAGSFIILGMVYQSLSPARILTSIIAERDKLFSGTRVYLEEGLEEFIKGVVGNKRYMDEIVEPKVIVPTTLSARSPPESVLITNYRKDPSGRRWMVHEAVHASAAVPTYFPAFEKKYVDGGLMVPNPTLVTITETLTNENESTKRPVATVVSLGTGSPPTSDMDLTEIVYPRLSSFLADVKQDLKYIYHLIDMLTANISNLGHTVAQSRAWCSSMGSQFYRFSPELTSLHDLDTKDDNAMSDIFYETYLYTLRNAQELENLACDLLNHGPQH